MIRLTLILIFVTAELCVTAQDAPFKVYNPEADASIQLEKAIEKAAGEKKHILLQIGGNWCKWCRMFYHFSNTTPVINSIIKSDYIVEHINYSPQNKNAGLLKKFNFPQRFGFPVFLILDETGKLLHTQNTAYLEEGEGYSEKKVKEFLLHWNRNALNEKNY